MTEEQTAGRFAGAFGIPRERALREVRGLLHRWYGLGYVSGGTPPAPEPIDLGTALAWILTNARLREDYRRSPGGTARRLTLKESDLGAFLSLDPDCLDVQAQALERKKLKWRERSSSPAASLLAREADRGFVATCHYALGTARFAVRFSGRDAEETVRPVLRHLETLVTQVPDWYLDVSQTSSGYELLRDGKPVGSCGAPERLPPLVKAQIRAAVVNRGDFFMELHAAAVFDGRACIVLPGAPGSGKTTLTAALAAKGFGFFSDEVALLEEETLWVRPTPLSLTIKSGSLAPLSPYYPQLPELPSYWREDGQQVRYLPPPSESISRFTAMAAPCAIVVFPRYQANATTLLRPLGRADAMQRLMVECMVLPRLFQCSDAASLTRWMRSTDCYELSFSSLPEAVDAIEALTH
jgi:hypothetical protein